MPREVRPWGECCSRPARGSGRRAAGQEQGRHQQQDAQHQQDDRQDRAHQVQQPGVVADLVAAGVDGVVAGVDVDRRERHVDGRDAEVQRAGDLLGAAAGDRRAELLVGVDLGRGPRGPGDRDLGRERGQHGGQRGQQLGGDQAVQAGRERGQGVLGQRGRQVQCARVRQLALGHRLVPVDVAAAEDLLALEGHRGGLQRVLVPVLVGALGGGGVDGQGEDQALGVGDVLGAVRSRSGLRGRAVDGEEDLGERGLAVADGALVGAAHDLGVAVDVLRRDVARGDDRDVLRQHLRGPAGEHRGVDAVVGALELEGDVEVGRELGHRRDDDEADDGGRHDQEHADHGEHDGGTGQFH